ncbi:hypothetical protein FA95DRAFT_768150 [Auriscalpium vulgare]|uniref:Uncharacterized protein n=1 Tax=Auriscalpium vulgare TaxID=40419 RepID=A0ACB8RB41_9AGAM|nr:hypothetical protein FA95DRAFT_768150 [Auriscalpium vulgare]
MKGFIGQTRAVHRPSTHASSPFAQSKQVVGRDQKDWDKASLTRSTRAELRLVGPQKDERNERGRQSEEIIKVDHPKYRPSAAGEQVTLGYERYDPPCSACAEGAALCETRTSSTCARRTRHHIKCSRARCTRSASKNRRKGEDGPDANKSSEVEDSEIDERPIIKRPRSNDIVRTVSISSQSFSNVKSTSDAPVKVYGQSKTAQSPLASGFSKLSTLEEFSSYGTDIEASQQLSADTSPTALSTPSILTPTVKSTHQKFWPTAVPHPSLTFKVIQRQHRVSSQISEVGLCRVRSTNVASVTFSSVPNADDLYTWETWRRVPSAYRGHLARACWRLCTWRAAWEVLKDAGGDVWKSAVGRSVKRHVGFIGKVLDALWEELRLAAEGNTLGAECRSPTLDHYLRIEGVVDGFALRALEKYLEDHDEASLDRVDPLHIA